MSASHPFAGKNVRIGTRGSPLALVQANLIATQLKNKFPDVVTEIVPIRASGDHDPAQEKDAPLYHQGGKGLFTKELEIALQENRIDLAVHSMKDVPVLDDAFVIACTLPREDPRDVFISPVANNLAELPEGAVVGTTSPRRQAQILYHWPHLKIAPLRGNVDTRLRKVQEGQVQGTLLAYAGLKRLGREKEMQGFVDVLPCAGQGVIGIEIMRENAPLAEMLQSINCVKTFAVLQAERAMLKVLNGSCQTPIAALARHEGDTLVLEGQVLHPEGKGSWLVKITGHAAQAEALGEEAGHKLRAQVPPGILPD